jgi:predicted ATPase with chaperone activity
MDVANGLPNVTVVGLPDAAAQEAREGMKTAGSASAFSARLLTCRW